MDSKAKLTGGRALLRRLARWVSDERGNIGPILALMVVPIVGAFAIGGETSSWYLYHRSQQNAADSAVIAAAMKADTTEANKVTVKYGYVDGQNNVTVTPTAGTSLCPAGAAANLVSPTCYKVVIARTVPLYLTRIVGYRDPNSGMTAKTIVASAIAGTVTGTTFYCLVSQQDIKFNGGGTKPDLGGCSMLAGGDLTCDSSNTDIGVPVGSAGGSNGTKSGQNSCGSDPQSGVTFTNPLTAQITTAMSDFNSAHPPSTCTTPTGGVITQTNITQGAVNFFCGNVTLGSAITISGDQTILAFENGGLNLNNFVISSSSGGSLTLLFTGTQLTSPLINWGNSGGFDFAAPSSKTDDWSGLAIVVDPSLQGGSVKNGKFTACSSAATGSGCPQDITTSGGQSSPPLHLTGIIYDVNGAVTISGTIDKASNSPNKCIGIDAEFIISNGGESFLEATQGCRQAGANLPTIPVVALLQ